MFSKAKEALDIIKGKTVPRYGNYKVRVQRIQQSQPIPRWKHQYEKDKEGAKQRQRKYYASKKLWFRDYRKNLRKETLTAYGGKCVCCKEKRWEFLTIDHPNGGGQQDREKHKALFGQLYRWLKDNNWPKGYQVLCMNCNWVRRGGREMCPHEVERLSAN